MPYYTSLITPYTFVALTHAIKAHFAIFPVIKDNFIWQSLIFIFQYLLMIDNYQQLN
jgi:hypothetical protein